MTPDHYQILGVHPAATMDEIKRVYRRRTMECHPDRGGLHDEMVLVIAAWEILSNPSARETYDASRVKPEDRSLQVDVAADAAQAYHRAQEYPRRWTDFEHWRDRMTGDFSEAQHGKTEWLWGVPAPTVRNSVTGPLFLVAGALLGVVFGTCCLTQFPKPNPRAKLNGRVMGMYVVAAAAAGAWVGSGLHRLIGNQFRKSANQSPAANHGTPRTTDGTEPQLQSPRRIVRCERSGQQLRIPDIASELLVTCGKCGNKFSNSPQP